MNSDALELRFTIILDAIPRFFFPLSLSLSLSLCKLRQALVVGSGVFAEV